MDFNFSPEWLYKLVDGKIKALICREEADFKIMIQGGYTDSPGAAKENKKHPACEAYFEEDSTQIVKPEEVKSDLTIKEVEELGWPALKAYGKKLEGIFDTDIITKNSKKIEVIAKIKELRNANSTSTNK